MNKLLLITLAFVATFAAQAQITKKVLIIGMDGCRSDALQLANTPNVDALIDNGFYSPDALNDDITISGPGWSAILCGVWSEKHLVTGNDFSPNNYAEFPPIFTRVEQYDPEFNTASICHWAPINDEIVDGSADYILNVTSDADLSSEAVDYITNNDPDCMFIHFDDIDHAGHSYGFSPDVSEYIDAIEITDDLIGPIIEAITMRPTYADEDWLILLTPDHGGNGFSHGGTSIEEERVFVIASGNTVETEVVLADSEVIIDDPDNCLGDDIPELQFDGDNDYVQVPDNELFNFGTDQDFTIECRVRTTESPDVSIVGNKDWDSG
ncbi:MAG: putative AlkP superfamily pyrophosphatase or phosphodiesterase, partial [Flavobacteriales bacterium]